jgi:hypothetical protein
MRRLAVAAAVVGSLLAVSCSTDQPQEPQAPQAPTEPSYTASDIDRICSTTTDPIQVQICSLFPRPLQFLTATAFYVAIKYEKRVGHTNSARALGIALVNITLELYNRGKLKPGTTWVQVRAFSCNIFTLVGVPDCGGLPTDAPSPSVHSTVQVCTSAAPCLVRPPDRHSGVQVPAGACPSICTISVNFIPATSPGSGPLNTFLTQYPLFRLFTLTIAGFDGEEPTFNSNVLVGICHLAPGEGIYAPPNATVEGRLKLARNNGEGIDIFDRVTAPFLFCDDLNGSSDELLIPSGPALRSSYPGWFASAAQSVYRRAVLPVIRRLLPEPAEATVGGCCLGALTNKVSPWAAVDPESGGS